MGFSTPSWEEGSWDKALQRVFWERDRMRFTIYIATSLCCDPTGVVVCQIRREDGLLPILEIATLGLGVGIILVIIPTAAAR